MQCFEGKSVCEGIVVGPITVWKKNDYQIMRGRVEDVDREFVRLERAIECSKEQLQQLYDKAVVEVGEGAAVIFEAYQVVLEDEDYLGSIRMMIREEQVNAEFAVSMTCDNFVKMFASMGDEYLNARAIDIKDVSGRLVGNLCGIDGARWNMLEPSIIVADDLTPSEMVRLDKSKLLAFVTVQGSANSHCAILARMMNVPALVGVQMNIDGIQNGMTAIVDGFEGKVVIEPDDVMKKSAITKINDDIEKAKLLLELKGKENVTKSGRKIDVYANVGSVDDVSCALENDAGGIGLFRSEFLYLGRKDFPTEEEQYQVYKQTAQMMGGKKVVIRTMDIGADKQVDYLDFGEEANPSLGYRAIRICLKRPDVFKMQLRAIFRAAVYGNISVMYPMITSKEEVERIYEIVEDVKDELDNQGFRYKVPEQGIMIETPAAVMISDELAAMVDFFSIGTNDLTQYTLAVDRENGKVEDFYNPHHKAILRMIQMVVDNAHRCGKRVAICGELAADITLTEKFVEMGIDELSVVSSMILKLRKIVREMTI